jgi:hypothetical protein
MPNILDMRGKAENRVDLVGHVSRLVLVYPAILET